jgi:hypothetical protein
MEPSRAIGLRTLLPALFRQMVDARQLVDAGGAISPPAVRQECRRPWRGRSSTVAEVTADVVTLTAELAGATVQR